MEWPPEIQEAKDRMNEAEAELRAYVESKEPRDAKKHRALEAKMQGTIREFERRLAGLLKNVRSEAPK